MAPSPQYPHQDGDITVLGPEIFASQDGDVISWKGENYIRQSQPTLPILTGPSLLYTSSVDNTGTRSVQRIDQDATDDPRERALCRALLHHALGLLDASEPARRAPVGAEARRIWVLAKSNGGPYDDTAVVAGMTCGALDQELKMTAALGTLPHDRYINQPLIKQADLIAMRHGYVLKPGEVDEASGWQHIAFDWA